MCIMTVIEAFDNCWEIHVEWSNVIYIQCVSSGLEQTLHVYTRYTSIYMIHEYLHDTRVFTQKTGLEVHTSIYTNQNK